MLFPPLQVFAWIIGRFLAKEVDTTEKDSGLRNNKCQDLLYTKTKEKQQRVQNNVRQHENKEGTAVYHTKDSLLLHARGSIRKEWPLFALKRVACDIGQFHDQSSIST